MLAGLLGGADKVKGWCATVPLEVRPAFQAFRSFQWPVEVCSAGG